MGKEDVRPITTVDYFATLTDRLVSELPSTTVFTPLVRGREAYWVQSRVVDGYVTQALACGLTMDEVESALAAGALADRALENGDRRVGLGQLLAFHQRIIELLDDDAYFIRNYDRLKIGYHGPIDTAALTAPRMGDSFRMYPTYTPLISNSSRQTFSTDEEGGWYRWTYVAEFDGADMVAARFALLMVRRMRDLYGDDLSPARLCLTLPRPEEVSLYADVFRAPIEFGASDNAILYSHKDMARENLLADERAHADAVMEAYRLLAAQELAADL